MSTEHSSDQNGGATVRDTHAQGVVRAAIVVQEGETTSMYPMFAVSRITPDGAFLASSMLLEVGEVVALELVSGDGVAARVNARIVAIERGEVPGMVVAFSGLDERASELISSVA